MHSLQHAISSEQVLPPFPLFPNLSMHPDVFSLLIYPYILTLIFFHHEMPKFKKIYLLLVIGQKFRAYHQIRELGKLSVVIEERTLQFYEFIKIAWLIKGEDTLIYVTKLHTQQFPQIHHNFWRLAGAFLVSAHSSMFSTLHLAQ